MNAAVYHCSCDCRRVRIQLMGTPRVRAYCHCRPCREVHQVPVLEFTSWLPAQLEFNQGEDDLSEFHHPRWNMTRYHCDICGTLVFAMNRNNEMVIASQAFRQLGEQTLPEALRANRHLHYASRVLSVNDSLPKYDQGIPQEESATKP